MFLHCKPIQQIDWQSQFTAEGIDTTDLNFVIVRVALRELDKRKNEHKRPTIRQRAARVLKEFWTMPRRTVDGQSDTAFQTVRVRPDSLDCASELPESVALPPWSGMTSPHSWRARRRLPRCPSAPPRPANVPENAVAVLLTDRVNWAWVDPDTADRFRDYRWTHRDKVGYVVVVKCGEKQYLHSLVCPPRPGEVVDHIDRDKSNNTRKNLRSVISARNAQNRAHIPRGTSRYVGVSKLPSRNRWRRVIHAFGKRFHIGYFETEVEAADAYDRAAILYHGEEFAKQNHARRRQPRPETCSRRPAAAKMQCGRRRPRPRG